MFSRMATLVLPAVDTILAILHRTLQGPYSARGPWKKIKVVHLEQ